MISPPILTTDNNQGLPIGHITDVSLANLRFIAETSIGTLADKNQENLLVFPHCIHAIHKDIDEKDHLFYISNKQLFTGNYLGFIGKNCTQIGITSRFDKDGNNYFMHYMLQKVFAINIFDLKFSKNTDNIWDFLIYLFPLYLKKALRQGVFKKYKKQQYNDSKIKGTINISRHIRKNIPFKGRVAYTTNEYDYDNDITQLIRHTIEFIGVHKIGGKNVLKIDATTQSAVSQIISATPSYNNNDRQSVIRKNQKIETHPYYTEYTFLQKLCLRILRQEKLSYGNGESNIYGLLFDGAWLWEEYLNTILKRANFKHPRNREKSDAIYLFQNNKCARYPDFYRENFVLDAKYKKLAGHNLEKIERNDMHQIISYLYVCNALKGGFVFPIEGGLAKFCSVSMLGQLKGYDGCIYLYGVPVPRCETFNQFVKTMEIIERDLLSKLEESDSEEKIERIASN